MGNRSLRKCQMPASLVLLHASHQFACSPSWRGGKDNSKGRYPLLPPSPGPSTSPRRLVAAQPVEQKLLAFNIGTGSTATYYHPPRVPSLTLLRALSLARLYGGRLVGSPGLVVLNPALQPLPQTLAPGWQDIAARALLFICIKQ